ncbi:MAG: hypothetical protein AAGE52_19760 [Myxococcota bacterium]
MLYGALFEASQLAEARDVLRMAHQKGFPGFFEELLRGYAPSLEPEELARAAHVDPSLVAQAPLARDDVEQATATLLDALQKANDGARLDPVGSIDVVLGLFVAKRPELARRVFAPLVAWIRTAGLETELEHHAATFILTSELASLPGDVDTALLAALAKGIFQGDPSSAIADVVVWGEATRYAERKTNLDVLKRDAPHLHRAVAPAFKAVASKGGRVSSNWWMWIVLASLGTFSTQLDRFCSHSADGDATDPASVAENAAFVICTLSDSTCETAEIVRDALRARDCPVAAQAQSQLDALTSSPVAENYGVAFTRPIQNLRELVDARCHPTAPSRDP